MSFWLRLTPSLCFHLSLSLFLLFSPSHRWLLLHCLRCGFLLVSWFLRIGLPFRAQSVLIYWPSFPGDLTSLPIFASPVQFASQSSSISHMQVLAGGLVPSQYGKYFPQKVLIANCFPVLLFLNSPLRRLHCKICGGFFTNSRQCFVFLFQFMSRMSANIFLVILKYDQDMLTFQKALVRNWK